MKVLRYFAATLCAVALSCMAVSCSDDDNSEVPDPTPGGGDDIPEVIEPTKGIDVTALYYGDYNDNGTGNFAINFVTSGMEWDDFEETYMGPGSLIYMELNSTLAQNADLAKLTDGTYDFDTDEDFALMTFSCSITDYAADGTQTTHYVKGGTLEVETAENGMYVMKGKFDIGTGTDYDFNYTGYIGFVNRTDEGYMSNLTENVEMTELTQCAALMWGETFTETSDYCSLIIAGPDYDLDENIGSSPALNIGLNITPGSTTIPEGTYTIIDAMDADDYDTMTALSGVYEGSYGGYFGTWYFAPQVEASMRSGTVEVTDLGNGKYTFKINLADGYGHTVKATYTGTPKIMS